MNSQVSAIIVTHNSEEDLSRCINALKAQTYKVTEIIIVDSGSGNTSYLDRFIEDEKCLVKVVGNIGFGAANNIGLSFIAKKTEYVVILNPDTFLTEDFILKAIDIAIKNQECGIITGTLKGYDKSLNRQSGYVDSTGVFRKWYGRWYDRGQGDTISTDSIPKAGYIPAICGALMFFRISAIENDLPDVFDDDFFMYKEDIELSIRIRKRGWKLYYSPELIAYHCRGWGRKRGDIGRKLRLESSVNEMKMYRKHPSPYVIWAIAKYFLVKWFDK